MDQNIKEGSTWGAAEPAPKRIFVHTYRTGGDWQQSIVGKEGDLLATPT